MQIVIGIGAKPTVSPFERVGLNSSVGGIQVTTDNKFLVSLDFTHEYFNIYKVC